jgi:hypothetical protein
VNPNLLTETGPKTDTEIVKLGVELRGLLTKAIKWSGKTAPEVAKEMAKRLGRPITESMMYEFTRNGDPGREVRLPATWVPAFCEITGDDRLQRFLAGPHLRDLIQVGEQVDTLDSILGRMLEAVAKLKDRGRKEKAQSQKA